MFELFRRAKSSYPTRADRALGSGIISVRATVRRLQTSQVTALVPSGRIPCYSKPRRFARFRCKDNSVPFLRCKKDAAKQAPWFDAEFAQDMVPSSPVPTSVSTVQMVF